MGRGIDGAERWVIPGGDPVLPAKLLVPAAPGGLAVHRPRLLDALTAAVGRPLTLVSAPAGSGKTVLLSSWARAGLAPGPIAWIDLDEDDDVPGVFWTYVLAALTAAGVDLSGIAAPEQAAVVERSLLVRLAARLCERTEPVVLVLDDAHSVTGQQILVDVDFLLRHCGGGLRLVVGTRVDPDLPLPQYRLRGVMTELRFTDLAFTPAEARELLGRRRPDLSDAAVQAHLYRTRGWAAGLGLADPSRGPRRDVGGADDAALVGSDIAAYFRTEVLRALPPAMQNVLLATSVVDRISPELAAHLSGARHAGATLSALAQTGAFVEATPGGVEAYRFHPLVRDLLRAQLAQEHPARGRRLHRKAAQWLLDDGRPLAAVQQLGAAQDWTEAARTLVRRVGIAGLLAAAPAADPLPVFARMPDDVPGAEAAVVAAAVAVRAGDLDTCEKHLVRAQELVEAEEDDGGSAGLRAAVALTALLRSSLAGDPAGAADVEHAEAVLATSPSEFAAGGPVTALLCFGRGSAELAGGDHGHAQRTLASAVAAAEEAGLPSLRAAALARLALAQAATGRLVQATVSVERALADVEGCLAVDAAGLQPRPALAALAWIHAERGELPEAAAAARRASADVLIRSDLVSVATLALVRGRLLRARGDLPRALAVLDAASQDLGRLPEWLEDRLAAGAAGVLLADGLPRAAADRVRRLASGETAVASLLALGWAALPVGRAAESGRIARQVSMQPDLPLDLRVEAHLLAAGAALGLNHADAARASLHEAITLAGPEGIQRPFDEAPHRLRALLQHVSDQAPAAVAAVRPVPAPRTRLVDVSPARALPGQRRAEVIVQPLTEREHEVLGYLDELLSTEEIAARMFVSVNTVKTHVRAILRKLSADRRNEAVRRARELGLV